MYVSRKNLLTWLSALCLVGSAVARIVIACVKGTDSYGDVWSQILLPIAAALLYALIVLLCGKEFFYKTAIPVWMNAISFGLALAALNENLFFRALVWIAVIFFGLLYTNITCGRIRYCFLLVPLLLCPLAGIWFLQQGNWADWILRLPDLLTVLGWLIIPFAIQVHPANEYHPTWGDRPDGRRIRTQSPIDQVSPYIMVARNESSNLFSASLEISEVERYIRRKRREGMSNFGIFHVILAAYCRGVCRYPAVNRFLSGQKVYTHGEDIQFCMTVKKDMSASAPDTCIKVHLSPRDTSADVYRKVNAAIEEVKNTPLDSGFDNLANLFTMIPGVFLKFAVWLLKLLDYFGLLPGFLLELSPFHGSVYLTSLGSLGISPVYHHLYDFGNLPAFVAFGCKRHQNEIQDDGTVVQKKYVDLKFTLDERTVDGFYYASFFKHFRRLFTHPDVLDLPPEEVKQDID